MPVTQRDRVCSCDVNGNIRSLQVTLDHYGHLFKSDDHKKAMGAIADDMFG
jgi:hypothetical protein